MISSEARLKTASLVLAAFSLALAATSADAEDRTLARMLQSVPHEFDRDGLEASVAFQDEDGALRSGVRCATRPIADFERQFIGSAIDQHIRAVGVGHRKHDFEVPVHFTILRKKDGSWNVSNSQISEQLDVLNRAFESTGISFVLDGVTRKKKKKFAKKCLKESVERKFKKRFSVEPATTLNIYTCRPKDEVLGYAYFPSDYPEDSFMHGIVLLHSVLPGGRAFPYDLGDTAVHEAGHYFGLYHTFQGGCSKKNDRISDTPREKRPASGCPVSRDTCPEPGLDPVTNYMDYSDDACVEEFTPEQSIWMKDQTETFRPKLAGS
ncbi:MAG: zinc metalloprotease [Thermoanaerobaculia bacterium]